MMKLHSANSAKKNSQSLGEKWVMFHSVNHYISVLWQITQLLCFCLKHHCRNCGDIYCNNCSSNELALPSYPKPVRVCDVCHSLLLQRSSIASWQCLTSLLIMCETTGQLLINSWFLCILNTYALISRDTTGFCLTKPFDFCKIICKVSLIGRCYDN